MPSRIVDRISRVSRTLRIPGRARAVLEADLKGVPTTDPGIDAAIDAGCAWLGRAQDMSTTNDGGAAINFSLIDGWGASYPETSGYIVPTLIDFARLRKDAEFRTRAKRMLDWLVSIQYEDGGFQAGRIGSRHTPPVVFNTGQILIGLALGVAEFGDEYREPMRRAADWLVAHQDPDGKWSRHQSPHVRAGAKAYDTHVAWGLFEAARNEPRRGYGEAGIKNVLWALSMRNELGWFDQCSIKLSTQPATHTIGYALRGVLEGYRLTGDRQLLEAAIPTADGLLSALGRDGHLPGRLGSAWQPKASWVCLTGSAQVATCWLMLSEWTKNAKYRTAGYNVNRFVRRTLDITGDPDTRGAVRGSFPVDGAYDPWLFPNWATKFMVDTCMLEKAVRQRCPV